MVLSNLRKLHLFTIYFDILIGNFRNNIAFEMYRSRRLACVFVCVGNAFGLNIFEVDGSCVNLQHFCPKYRGIIIINSLIYQN